jgi:hypothetical protein
VIYVPRRGLLEIWQVRSGERHAIMNVGENCVLFSSITDFARDPTQSIISRCFLFHRTSLELDEILVDLSLHGLTLESTTELEKLVQLISQSDPLASEEELLALLKKLPNIEQMFRASEHLFSLVIQQLEPPDQSESNLRRFSAGFLQEFLDFVLAQVKVNQNSPMRSPARGADFKHISQSPKILNEMVLYQRIDRVIRVIVGFQKLFQLIQQNSNSNSEPEFLIPENFIEPGLDILICFDFQTGRMKANVPQEISMLARFLFQWLSVGIPKLSDHASEFIDRFLELIFSLRIESFELQYLFTDWYFSQNSSWFSEIPDWPSGEQTFQSIQILLSGILRNANPQTETEIFDPIYQKSCESTQFSGILQLSKIILTSYEAQDNLIHQRIWIQKWTIFKSRISTVCHLVENLSGILPVMKQFSLVRLETSDSVFYLAGFLQLLETSSSSLVNSLGDGFEFNFPCGDQVTENREWLVSIFPDHFSATYAAPLVIAHQIQILATVWNLQKVKDLCNFLFYLFYFIYY